jgi:hypothetical protein
VCQLDILKRLRPDAPIIRAALSNLPKTLDETYERILRAIPQDDRLSVQHVFHWLVYHNELFSTNIPVSTLLQAVQQSTVDSFSQDADRLYDIEGLRELCGSLIMIEQEKLLELKDGEFQTNVCFDERSTVTFAHYTVKEYLQSPRISKRKIEFFALAQERVHKQFAEIALLQALAIQPGTLANQPGILASTEESYDPGTIHRLLDIDFKLYCGISSVRQLLSWSESISEDSTLMDLSEELFNPHRLAYGEFCSLHQEVNHSALYTEVRHDNFEAPKGLEILHRNTGIFLNFLIISRHDDTLHHLRAFSKRHPMHPILMHQLDIKRSFYQLDDDYFDEHRFVGSIPDMVAHCGIYQPHAFSFILDLISEHGAVHFDLSTLLLSCIGSHKHGCCENSCSLERLLHLGASAKGPEGAFVTPLQIAVVLWDFEGVEMLLSAGADPNALGEIGSAWAPDSFMVQFNICHGRSSLLSSTWTYSTLMRKLWVALKLIAKRLRHAYWNLERLKST